MTRTALVFPGQGSQFVGMGSEVWDADPKAKRVFDVALSQEPELGEIMAKGPEERLKQTQYTQPAIVAHSLALWELAQKHLPAYDFVAGHSVGEYSALAVAGYLSIEDALGLVTLRGRAMQRASELNPGTMAALLGGSLDEAVALCDAIANDSLVLQIANLNCPGQVVISGSVEAIGLACDQAKEFGFKRAIPLVVGGAFHSSLMQPALEQLSEGLDKVDFHAGTVPLVSNVEACGITDPQELKEAMRSQVVAQVRWEESVRWLVEQGVTTIFEIGPGKTLSGLIRKIDRSVTTHNISCIEDIKSL